ncbi:hypothetical protein MIND_00595100 [Mycena indigotica]|uniref:DUF6534 domain-containing protein n=1 Tax=Mycena indigotica TaxID=2126181 RepID=A0A8H6SSN4_9AGAR|nr:uncharacterized protein MIND_00595100 [Mycena indigotica]KAF7303657.1 hypothetical protein MIND_00595100 [Mycena indigotica]
MAQVFNLDLTLGPIICGAFVCVFFFGVICMQTAHYLTTFPNDSNYVKSMVVFLWAVQLGFTIAICQNAYGLLVTDFGQVFALLYSPWGLNVAQILGGVINHGVQAFFILQIFRATRALYLCIFLWILVALLEALTLFLSAHFIRTRSIAISIHSPLYYRLLLVLFFSDAALDLINASILCFYLRRQRQSAFSTRTITLVDRLVVYTLQTGLSTSLVAVASAVCLKVAPDNYVWILFFSAMPCSFLSALLANINNRGSLRFSQQHTSVTSDGTRSSGRQGVRVKISRSVLLTGGSVKMDSEVLPRTITDDDRGMELDKMDELNITARHLGPQAV